MTHYKPLINVVYNDEDYYVRKRKISCAAEILQGKYRYKKKVYNTLTEIEITYLAGAWGTVKNGKDEKKDNQGVKVKSYLLDILILWCKLWGEIIEEFHTVEWYGLMYT